MLAVLDRSWVLCWLSSAALGASIGGRGRSWAVLGDLEQVLGDLRALLGRSWAVLGDLGPVLGRSSAVLGQDCFVFRLCSGCFGLFLLFGLLEALGVEL